VKQDCTKCGAELSQLAIGAPYCPECKVRLGYVPFSAGRTVEFGPAYYYQKQVDEVILDTWCMETNRRLEALNDQYEERLVNRWQSITSEATHER